MEGGCVGAGVGMETNHHQTAALARMPDIQRWRAKEREREREALLIDLSIDSALSSADSTPPAAAGHVSPPFWKGVHARFGSGSAHQIAQPRSGVDCFDVACSGSGEGGGDGGGGRRVGERGEEGGGGEVCTEEGSCDGASRIRCLGVCYGAM